MTGTVHDRAIAEELRLIAAATEHVAANLSDPPEPLNERIGKAFLLGRADNLEAAAPPATIDSIYTGNEPPVGTVLSDPASVAFIAVRAHDEYWLTTGSEEGDGWAEILADASWTVLRWGTK